MVMQYRLPGSQACKRTCCSVVLLFVAALGPFQSASAQQPLPLDPLTAQEKRLAEDLASNDLRVKERLGTGRQRLIHSVFLAIKPEDESKTREDWIHPIQIGRHAEVIFYRYDGNLGVRAVTDITDIQHGLVKEVVSYDGDEVPLAPEEVDEAGKLALQVEEVRGKLGDKPHAFKIEGLRILTIDKKDFCYGHRCVGLLFRRGAFYLAEFPVTVDLTTLTVRVGRRLR